MDWSLIFDIISTVAIIIAIVFGLIELRHYHLARKRDSALFILNSYQTAGFLHGTWTILSIPDGLTKEEIEHRVGDDIKDVYLVMSTWERIGILVFHHEVTLDLIDDSYSGTITLSWNKLAGYVNGMREEFQRETIFEWFQWLAERMREREETSSPVPAHIAHRDWVE